MKRNMTFVMVLLTGCVCAWSYLAAQSNKESPVVNHGTSEIKEPSREDFDFCINRATAFLESISDNPMQTDLALQVLFGEAPSLERQMSYSGMSELIVQMKRENEFGPPELVAKRNIGENVIVLYFASPAKPPKRWVNFSRVTFTRTSDENGKPQQWVCESFLQHGDIEFVLPFVQ